MIEVREGHASAHDEDRPPTPPRGRLPNGADLLFLVSVAAAVLPIVVATIRAARRGWLPVGDNAYFAVRSMDVFTEHHPLLGTWTSASLNTDTNFNNPGPLLFDLLAVPVKVLGTGMGLGIGVAFLNALAVIGIAVVTQRRGGPLLGTAGMAMTALLSWTMGSELLYDPWQPHSLLLTFLLVLVLVWSLACGDLAALPWAVFLGSVVVQTHLSYAILLSALWAGGMAGLGLFLSRARRQDSESWPSVRRRAIRSFAVAVAVGLLCWAQPLAEQATAEEEGNLSRLATDATASDEKVGARLGTRIVADVLTAPPSWVRPSFEEALRPDLGAAAGAEQLTTVDYSFPAAVGVIATLGIVVAGLLWDARRRRDAVTAGALSTAVIATGGALLTAWSLPTGKLGLPPHQFRWLWPIGAFLTLTVLTALVRRSTASDSGRRKVILILTAVTVVAALANLPYHNVRSGPTSDDYAIPVIKQLGNAMGVLEEEGTLVIDLSAARFAEPYSGPVIAELQRRDIPFAFQDEGLVRQFGSSRRLDGDAQRLLIREGDSALITPAGMRRAVLVEGLTATERRELVEVRDEVLDHLRSLGRLPLNDRGTVAISQKHNARRRQVVEASDLNAEMLVESRTLQFLIENRLLELDENVRPRFERYAELQQKWDRETVGLFLAPLDEGPPS